MEFKRAPSIFSHFCIMALPIMLVKSFGSLEKWYRFYLIALKCFSFPLKLFIGDVLKLILLCDLETGISVVLMKTITLMYFEFRWKDENCSNYLWECSSSFSFGANFIYFMYKNYTESEIIIHVNIIIFWDRLCMLYIFTFIKLLHMLDVLYAFDLVHTRILQNK